MKSFLLSLLVFLIAANLLYPQWTNQNPVPDGNSLFCTYFANDSTGWIVGSEGFIIKTTNCGVDWLQQNSGTTLLLKSVQFVDANNGWICGESGLILKTTDGGANWIALTSGRTEHLADLHFNDTDTGYVVGFGGTILKTTNGGLVWTSLSSGTVADLYSVDFVDASLGYVVGGVDSTLTVLKTTDGGVNWNDKSNGIPRNEYEYLISVEFVDANIGFVGNEWELYKTTNGGDSWLRSIPPVTLDREKKNNKEQLGYYPLYGVNSIFFKDADNGWIINWFDPDIYIKRTTDGGTSWETEYFQFEEGPFSSIFITQNGSGYVVGSQGLIGIKEYNSSDWSLLFSGHKDEIYSIQFVSENLGWAAAYRIEGNSPHKSLVLNTTNGGKMWKSQLVSLSNVPMIEVYFLNELYGWAVNAMRGVYLTTDGGINWANVSSSSYKDDALHSEERASIYFIDENIGWYTGQEYSNSWINKSTDGGNTWNLKSSVGGLSVFFIDQNIGWVVGDNGILKSTDGGDGDTWFVKSSSTASFVRFYDANIGMCVGGEDILVSTDGGESWSTKNGPSLQSINFINSSTIWGYTSEGTVYKTTDFGDTWSALNSGLGYGETSFFINENMGWVGGDWGGYMVESYIYKYSSESNPITTHFTTVWLGNPYLAMNLYITSAQSDGEDLDAGDEIGIFDGDYCVGSILLTEPIPSGGYVQVLASTDDPITPEIDGFTVGDTITYKIWDSTKQSEIDRITPNYIAGDGNFVSQGTAVVSLDGIFTITENCGFTGGWNMFSLMVTPDDADMLQLLDPLISADVLVKVQDEAGNAVEELPPPIGWINNIGDWLPTEGYYTKITPGSAATLSITGPPTSLPLDIPLNNGWNIMGYPVSTEQNALDVLQPLITANQLVKVQDEAGNAVEELPPPIGWINNIGNFRVGEGYYIKVNNNTSITMDEPVVLFAKEEKWKNEDNWMAKMTADHFIPVWTGNGYLIMNIYVTGVELIGGGSLVAGDEIGVFDGDYCVGATLLTEPIPSGGYVQIKASTDELDTPEIDGFIAGNTISYKFWLSATSEEITDYNVSYTPGEGRSEGQFISQGSAFISFTNVLPVELVSFTVDVKDSKIQLSWQTATEVNNFGFDIERMIDEEEWDNIGFIEGHGNSNSPKSYTFTDEKPFGGSKFHYRLKQVDTDGSFEYSSEVEIEIIPNKFELYQNYPNPFNPITTVRYQVPKESKVEIKLYDVLGSEVVSLVNENKDPGYYEVELNGLNLSSGTYIYRMIAGNFVEVKKMVLMK